MWASSAYGLLPIPLSRITVGGAKAACYGPDQRMDPKKAANFRKDPAQFAQKRLAAAQPTAASPAYAAVTGNQLIGGSVGGRAGGASAEAVGGTINPVSNSSRPGSTLQVFNSSGTNNTALSFFQGRPPEPAALRRPPPLPIPLQRTTLLLGRPV
jgi:hypothetical protein